jgi:hypothetical protein
MVVDGADVDDATAIMSDADAGRTDDCTVVAVPLSRVATNAIIPASRTTTDPTLNPTIRLR